MALEIDAWVLGCRGKCRKAARENAATAWNVIENCGMRCATVCNPCFSGMFGGCVHGLGFVSLIFSWVYSFPGMCHGVNRWTTDLSGSTSYLF